MRIRNEKLFGACRRFAEEAFALLEVHHKAGDEIPSVERIGFEVERAANGSGGSFGETKTKVRSISPWIRQKYHKALLELESFKLASELMLSDPEVASQMNQHVGTTLGTNMIRPRWILQLHLLENLWNEQQFLQFEDDAFKRVYARLEEFLYSRRLSTRSAALLENFNCTAENIDLGEGVSIRELGDSELQQFYAENIAFRKLYKDQLLDVPRFAIIIELARDKVIGSHVRADEPVIRVIDSVISVLRLLKAGFIEYRMVELTSGPAEWGCYPSTNWEPHHCKFRTEYRIENEEISQLRELWSNYCSVAWEQQRFLRTALDRFNFGSERSRPEDRIVDYVVCLEALLLHSLNKEDRRGELTFRIALHGAKLLGTDYATRERAFRDLKAAYRVRSDIVHGSRDLELPKKPSGGQPSLEEFIEAVEDYARRALSKFIDLAKGHRTGPLIDWNELLLKVEGADASAPSLTRQTPLKR